MELQSEFQLERNLDPRIRNRRFVAALIAAVMWGVGAAAPVDAESIPTGASTGAAMSPAASLDLRTPAAYARFVARGGHRELSPAARDRFFVAFAREAPRELAAMWRAVGAEVPPEAGALAAPRLEQLALSRVSRIAPEDQLGMLLGEGARRPSSKQNRKERTRAIRALSGDPALGENFARIDDRWLDRLLVENARRGLLYASPEELVEVKVLIARNLYFAGAEVTRTSVRAEALRLLDLRDRFGAMPVFSGREVILVASDDRVDGSDRPVFGTSRVRKSLEREAAGIEQYGGESPSVPTDRVLSRVEHASRLTFVFSGHGRPGALKYHGALKIRELARALAEQSRRTGESVIAVLLACRAHDYARNLLDAFERLGPGLPKPILITPEEYGQAWIKPGYGSELATVLADRSEAVTLSDLGLGWGLAASVFVPDEDNIPRQIY
jgi:hypothetical protein